MFEFPTHLGLFFGLLEHFTGLRCVVSHFRGVSGNFLMKYLKNCSKIEMIMR